MSQNPSNDTSNAPLTEEEWLKFYRLMDSLETKVSSGEKLSEDETEFYEKYHKVYRLHMELGKRLPEIMALEEKLEGLTEKASQEIEKLNKTLEKR
jgi:hypothetical protein